MFDNFHFIRPFVLLLVPLLLLVVWLWMRLKLASSEWQSILPSHLHQRLISSKGNKQSRQPFIWLMLALSIGCVAAAGPAWEKLPQPVYQTSSGRVLVMDMSLSMRATDVSPSRLARAKFKAIDLIKEINDGEVGLVAYAGDAFMISPLTEDISNLENLIPSLSPEIMPSDGSKPMTGLELASTLLENAGYQNGHIYWITDGIEFEDVKPVRDIINSSGYQFSALTIGTEDAAPIQLLDGSLLKDNRGAIVIPKVNFNYLQQALSPANARQTKMSIDSSDIQSMLLTSSRLDAILDKESQQSTGDAWRDMGVYLVLLMLPIALFFFRKGVLFCAALFCIMPLTTNEALAQDVASTQQQTGILQQAKSLFLNDNQKGRQAFEAENYEQAVETFKDTKWRAAAAYKAGDYETAFELYQQSEGLESIYNSGNALAKMGELQKALDTYEKVLQLDPEHEDAKRNKAVIEELKKQQEQQEQQQNGEQDNQQDSDQSDNKDQQNQQQDGSQGQQNEQDSQQSDQQSQESQESEGEQQEGQNQQQESQQQSGQPENSENEQQDSQQGSQEQDEENERQDEQGAPGADAEQSEQEQEAQTIQAIDQNELTPEQREQMQRLQTLMNKVPDDPAYLLQRKMLIEAQRRKQFAPPTNNQQEW
jgi:Ca-activated chloride channel family protein